MEQNHMLEKPPSYAQSHDPQSLNLPSVPATDPPQPPPTIHHERTLPPLPPAPSESRYRSEEHFTWPSSNPLTAYYQPGPSQLSPKSNSIAGKDSPMRMDLDMQETRGRRGGSVLSIDDPDVRLAAEALGDLRADFVQSPPHNTMSLPSNSPTTAQRTNQQPEPLLSLLTTSHPFLGTAIGGSLSAYSASKNYSPRFKSSAEFLENRFTPVVNTITSVNRMTGVEGGVRWFLGGRRPSHHPPTENSGEGSNKRRKVDTDDQDSDRNISRDPYPVHRQELQHRQRAPSHASNAESLPAYDDYRSPSYEDAQQALVPTQPPGEVADSGSSSWHSRLVLSTSGLSVAMSEESLRSLKYCLGWLRWANEHIGKVILALKAVLEQYEHPQSNNSGTITNSEQSRRPKGQMVVRSDAERIALHAKIAELKKDVLKTLKSVVDIVSKYAGGALPDNAKILVRRHLTSLPQRFRIANERSDTSNARGLEQGDAEVTDGANRVLVLAKEGLDMMAQVSGVLDGTIVSAEEWCERLGMKKREEAEGRGGSVGSGSEKSPSVMSPMAMDGERNGYGFQDGDSKMG
ncbi:hypothetical protein HYALB_00004853 [Hymenoscyphus albidus]|uniref:Opi1-domain-containing protein n=1 Tax=Hymenoscyphus albidus TaxID=595503 RepID=A0A9N9M0J5_9HELO|nr:hypothetical protein HYALB_00004853 [Hymenoscyphus albidus]